MNEWGIFWRTGRRSQRWEIIKSWKKLLQDDKRLFGNNFTKFSIGGHWPAIRWMRMNEANVCQPAALRLLYKLWKWTSVHPFVFNSSCPAYSRFMCQNWKHEFQAVINPVFGDIQDRTLDDSTRMIAVCLKEKLGCWWWSMRLIRFSVDREKGCWWWFWLVDEKGW